MPVSFITPCDLLREARSMIKLKKNYVRIRLRLSIVLEPSAGRWPWSHPVDHILLQAELG